GEIYPWRPWIVLVDDRDFASVRAAGPRLRAHRPRARAAYAHGVDIKSVRVAAVQAAPAILDLEGCVEKIETLTRAAVADGAQLVVLPETFIPMYPMSRLTHSNWDPRQTDLFEQIWANAVEAPGPVVDRLAALCRELDVHLAVGVNEREP